MKIHKCYFCNYETKQKTHLKDHVMKQNKCSYLIKSIPINSIEDYYNLVEKHKASPDDPEWGEDSDITPDYYNSSDEELDDEKKKNIEDNKNYIQHIIDKKINNKKNYICTYCNFNFSRKDHLNRHLNGRCKVLKKIKLEEETKIKLDEEKKLKEEEEKKLKEEQYKEQLNIINDKEFIEQITLLKNLMEHQKNEMEHQKNEMEQKQNEMEQKIKQLEENNNNLSSSIINSNNNNSGNNCNNKINKQVNQQIKNQINNDIKNITINNFGGENKGIFNDDNYMLSWINAPFNAIPNMIEKLHFNPDKRPENTNIRINNISNGKAQIFKYGEWKTIMKHELIYELIGEYATELIETYNQYLNDGKIKRMKRFEKFIKQYEGDDSYFVKSQTQKVDCKLVDLMKKHKNYLNSL